MEIKDIKAVYFIGAGGIGMSAIARYFLKKGLTVAGYDKTYEDSQDDDDTTHRRNANLLDTKRVDAGIALCLCNLLALEILDEFLAEPGRDYQ